MKPPKSAFLNPPPALRAPLFFKEGIRGAKRAPLKGELSLQATEGLYVRGRASESRRHFPIEGRRLAAPRLLLKATHFSPFGPAAFPRKGVWETL